MIEDYSVRSYAISILGEMREQADLIAPRLIKATRHPNRVVRSDAIDALGALDPGTPESVKAVRVCLSDRDFRVRRSAADALGDMRDSSSETLAGLERLLSDRDRGVCVQAAYALAQIGPPAKQSVPALLALFGDQYDGVRIDAAGAVWCISQDAEKVVPVLISCLSSTEKQTGSHSFGTPYSKTIPNIVVRGTAIHVLRQIGPPAAAALPHLRRIARGPHLSQDAEKAIAAIARGKPSATTKEGATREKDKEAENTRPK